MKSQEFGAILKTLAEMLGLAGSRVASDQLAALAKAFESTPATTVALVVKRLAQCPSDPGNGGGTLGDVAQYLAPVPSLFASVGKTAVAADFEVVQQLLLGCRSLDIGTFVRYATETTRPANVKPKGGSRSPDVPVLAPDALIANYHQKLEAALGDDDKFMPIYKTLSADKMVKVAEAKALAKQFTNTSARTKIEALGRILSRHQSLLTFKAKQNATDGRSAA